MSRWWWGVLRLAQGGKGPRGEGGGVLTISRGRCGQMLRETWTRLASIAPCSTACAVMGIVVRHMGGIQLEICLHSGGLYLQGFLQGPPGIHR